MSVQEKIDILSLRFDVLWYKIWLEFPETGKRSMAFKDPNLKSLSNRWRELYIHKKMGGFPLFGNNIKVNRLGFYIKKKNKYESLFMYDNGKRLKSLIEGTDNIELMWEIPKGRKTKKETMLDCAIRECKEETNMGISNYNLLINIKPVVESYISDSVKYVHNYYIAYTDKAYIPRMSFKTVTQVSEIESVKWVSLDEIKFIDISKRLYKIVYRVFQVFRAKYKIIKN